MKYLFPQFCRGLMITLSLLFGLVTSTVQAQVPAWQMALIPTQKSNSHYSVVYATATDDAGNVFLAGSFGDTLRLGATTLVNGNTSSADAFVAKWNPVTGFVWAQRIGGMGDDYASSIAVSGNSVYVSGYYAGTSTTVGGITLPNAAGANLLETYDIFIAKLTDQGPTASVMWAQHAGGEGSDYGLGIAVSGNNVYVAGQYASLTAVFGPVTLMNPNGSNAINGSYDAFVTKLTDANSNATFTWARQTNGSGGARATSIALNGASVYITGSIYGGSTTFGNITLVNAGSEDVFVAKLTDAGPTAGFIWAQQAGGQDSDRAEAIAVNGRDIYVAGEFYSPTAVFGTTTLINAGGANRTDMFVTKITDVGSFSSFIWAQRAGGTGSEQALAIAVHNTSVYVAGTFNSTSSTFGNFTLTNANAQDLLFVSRIIDGLPSPSFAWAQKAGEGGIAGAGSRPESLIIANGHLYVAGRVSTPATFGSITVGNRLAYSVGFLASLADPVITATASIAGALPFTVYPNPARTTATVTLLAVPGANTATLTLYDALGQVVRTATSSLPAAGLQYNLSLHGLARGLYVLHVTAGNDAGTYRLVVE